MMELERQLVVLQAMALAAQQPELMVAIRLRSDWVEAVLLNSLAAQVLG